MRHVDDGTLQAWLDGEVTDAAMSAWVEEHLRTCGECAARRAAARATIDEAGALLALVAPADERPRFEDLVQRAGGVPAQLTEPYRRWVAPAAWAASVVLAAATGWIARDLTVESGRRSDVSLVAEAPRAPGARLPAEPAMPAAVVPPTPTAAPGDTGKGAPDDAPVRRQESERDMETTADVPVRGQTAPRATPQPLATPSVSDAQANPADAPAVTATESIEPAAPAITVTGESAPAGVPAVAPPAAPAGAAVLGGIVAKPEPVALQGWRPVSRTEAAAVTQMPLYGIDGLAPASTSMDSQGTAVRTVYRLPSGSSVELVQQRVKNEAGANAGRMLRAQPFGLRTADVAAAPAGGAMWSDVRGDVRLTMRAPADAPDLSELSKRLRFD